MKQPQRELEEMVVDAWPAHETEEQDGWLLRFSGGPTRRGNSVSTLDCRSARPLDEQIADVERWYAARGRAAVFQVGPCVQPKELGQALATRRYLAQGESAFAAAPAFAVAALAPARGVEVQVSAKLEPAWLEVTAGASRFAADLDGLRGFLKRLGSRCRFASARDAQGSPIACCLGIASEDRLGVYAMVTQPAARRQGAARALLRALAESALADAMRELYLLVELENAPARALYASCGFRDVYTYHYRTQPK